MGVEAIEHFCGDVVFDIRPRYLPTDNKCRNLPYSIDELRNSTYKNMCLQDQSKHIKGDLTFSLQADTDQKELISPLGKPVEAY